MLAQWFPWYARTWCGKVRVARCESTWAMGSGYRFARNARGRIVSFWTRRAAQRYADQLNRETKS